MYLEVCKLRIGRNKSENTESTIVIFGKCRR